MNKGGIGVGSASIVLVFAVLCLTVFTLISLSAAVSDKALTDASADMVTAYYEADTLAERVLAEILAAGTAPPSVRGIPVSSYWDWDLLAEIASFSCPLSDSRELFVEVAIYDGSYDVLQWIMRDIGGWEADDTLNVWLG